MRSEAVFGFTGGEEGGKGRGSGRENGEVASGMEGLSRPLAMQGVIVEVEQEEVRRGGSKRSDHEWFWVLCSVRGGEC